ncbi:MAG: methylmalonyl-CoA epimerase [Bacteroidetes bacterium]|nr:methylmalonyl-CoA epimerase [Bacteroidota bacterium]
MKKIDHIGIAVNDIDEAILRYQRLLNSNCSKVEEVASEQVKTAFFSVGESKIELLGAISGESAIAKFLSKKSEGIHHIAFEVDDIYAEIERLKGEGFTPLSETPKKGADNKLICFFHPKDTNGVLIEICQSIR